MAVATAAAMVAAITAGEDEDVIIERRQPNQQVTLCAYSFDFVGHNIPGGKRTIDVNVLFADDSGDNAVACVGPGTTTVTQTKVFSTSYGVDRSTP